MTTLTEPGSIELPAAGVYRIDPDASAVTFRTRHVFGLAPVRGRFRLRGGRIDVADPPAGSAVTATVDAASFHTGTGARDRKVRSATYLDAARHPDITFTSARLDQEVLHGSLTVRGVTRPVELTITTLRPDGRGLLVRATAVVDRYAFGITAMRGMAARRLRIELDVLAGRDF